MGPLDTAVHEFLRQGLGTSAVLGAVFTVLLLAKSVADFTRTGPHITGEVLSHYRLYLVYSLGRLALFAWAITSGMAFLGVSVYALGVALHDLRPDSVAAVIAGLVGILLLSARQFVRTLLYNPGVIAASSLYSMTHFYPLWERLTPARLRVLDVAFWGVVGVGLVAALVVLAEAGAWSAFWALACIGFLYATLLSLPVWDCEPRPAGASRPGGPPNILLIGADTLRADRLEGQGYPRSLTPTLDRLGNRATRFTSCYVPCARTAPSLASMLTGTWPHTHGVRDTFLPPEQTRLPLPTLPEIFRAAGYQTAAVGDWAASDVSKLSFNFQYLDLPPDQWNIKYLLRQGPKDIRLFLSLFTQNRFGKRFLPEIYYLGGVPLTEEVGRDTRRMITRLAGNGSPFFVMSFMAITHPPFASKYPYYAMYADRRYRGASKFAMAKLRDPFEIIRRQGEPRSEFDLDQIIDLYDGCVRNFDDEVARMLEYLEVSGLSENTIVVIFSDHGFEFFEHETWGQGNSAIGDFSARVPLIIADPRRPEPHVVPNVVRTVDVAPTLLELAGLPVGERVEGVSLVPLMRGESLPGELPAFYETGVWLTDLPGTPEKHLRYPELPDLLEVPDKRLGTMSLKPEFLDVVIAAKDRMVRLGDWKLTYQPLTDGPRYQLFNIREDPGCRHNVLDQHPEVVEELRSLLLRWLNGDRRGFDAARPDQHPSVDAAPARASG